MRVLSTRRLATLAEVVPIDMSVDDAMKMIVTLGVVVPPGTHAGGPASTGP